MWLANSDISAFPGLPTVQSYDMQNDHEKPDGEKTRERGSMIGDCKFIYCCEADHAQHMPMFEKGL